MVFTKKKSSAGKGKYRAVLTFPAVASPTYSSMADANKHKATWLKQIPAKTGRKIKVVRV